MEKLLEQVIADTRERLSLEATSLAALPARDRALRTFGLIDEVMTALHFVYPGRGYVSTLYEGLSFTSVDDEGRQLLLARAENAKRKASIEAAGTGPFHIADCDIFSVIYVAVGERLELPISFIHVPSGPRGGMAHAFVAWILPSGEAVRWDADSGKERHIEDDEWRFGDPPLDGNRAHVERFFDVPMTRDELRGHLRGISASVWSGLGVYDKAIAELRKGLQLRPRSPVLLNELAWLLATAPDPRVRNPREAIELAEAAVELWPAPNNLDTLATAYGNSEQWAKAVEVQLRALDGLAPKNNRRARYQERLTRFCEHKIYISSRPHEQEAMAWQLALQDGGWGTLRMISTAVPDPPVLTGCEP